MLNTVLYSIYFNEGQFFLLYLVKYKNNIFLENNSIEFYISRNTILNSHCDHKDVFSVSQFSSINVIYFHKGYCAPYIAWLGNRRAYLLFSQIDKN